MLKGEDVVVLLELSGGPTDWTVRSLPSDPSRGVSRRGFESRPRYAERRRKAGPFSFGLTGSQAERSPKGHEAPGPKTPYVFDRCNLIWPDHLAIRYRCARE